jgi:4-diphosphocytidyl-2-C-methyl-D-erythritol kinase
MNELIINTPAKINLGINVISKRDDGYHNIETIFYPIKLFDTLTFTKSDSFAFESDNDLLNNDPDNLVIRAKNLIELETGKIIKVKIKLEKRIPVGGGLGGGSSDAAATLLGLNSLFNLQLDNQKLSELALSLGSDVPFFLKPEPCFANSRGEKIQYLDISIPHPVLLVNPGIHISTKWAFSQIIPSKPSFSLRALTSEQIVNYELLRNNIVNDFEAPIFKKHPEIKSLKEMLYNKGALFALMSGSGSTVFGIFKNSDEEIILTSQIPDNYFIFLNK